MERVLRAGLDDCESVLLVGADCPGVGRPQFEAATRALITHDAYLAPTLDGGFYLVGVRRIAPDLFGGVTFSVASACAATAARFEALGLRVAIGDPWFDVDDAAGLDVLRERAGTIEASAPRTIAVLRMLEAGRMPV